jgi:Spy/CpxP family protein refolding chaperone
MNSIKKTMTGLAVLCILSIIPLMSTAQQGANRSPARPETQQVNSDKIDEIIEGIPGITPEQRAKIEELKTKHLSASLELRAKIREKRAHIETLALAEKPNQKEIDATIDEVAALSAELQKKRMAFRLGVRELLTPQQRVYFDQRLQRQGKVKQANGPRAPQQPQGPQGPQGNERRPAQ